MDILGHFHWVAIDMEGGCLFTLEGDFAGADGIHKKAVVDALGEQAQCQSGCTEKGGTAHNTDVHLAVLNTGLGCNIRLVAPLARIGKRNQKRLVRNVDTFAYQVISLCLVGQYVLDDILEIGLKTAFGRTCKLAISASNPVPQVLTNSRPLASP